MRPRARTVVAGVTATVAALVAVDYPRTTASAAFAAPAGKTTPAAIADSMVAMYDVGGVTVIQRRSPTSRVAAATIFLLGGSRQIDAGTAGVEPVMLSASEFGTRKYPGGAVREAIARTGAQVEIGVTPDWTTIGFVGLAEDFDSTWSVVADRVVAPTLDSAAVAIAKRRGLASLSARGSSPEAIARQMAESLAYGNHPYRRRVEGTTASLTALTPDAVQGFHRGAVATSRLLVVVAGNLTRAQVENAVRGTLATLPKGAFAWSLPERFTSTAPGVALRRQPIPTNYIVGMVGGPVASAAEVTALRAGLGVMSSYMSGIMRDSGLTYSAGAGILERGATAGVLYVTTPEPERAFKIINNIIDYVANAAQVSVTNAMLTAARNYAFETETSDGQIDALSTSHLYHGDFRYAENFATVLRQTSPSDISRAVRAYVKNIQWAFVGDTTKAPRALMLKY